MNNIVSVLNNCKKPFFFWITTILLQILLLSTCIATIHSIVKGSSPLIFVWMVSGFSILLLSCNLLQGFFSKKCWDEFDSYSIKYREDEAKLDELHREMKKALFSGTPVLGILSLIFVIRCFSVRDSLLKRATDLNSFIKYAKTNLNFWGILQIISCISLFVICGLLSINNQGNEWYRYVAEWIAATTLLTYAVSFPFNKWLIYRCNLLIRNLNELDDVRLEKIKIWRTCMKWSYLVYFPVIGMLSLIPFFVSKSIKGELVTNNSYVHSCKNLLIIFAIAIICPIPYVLYGGLKHEWLTIIPLLLWIISFTIIAYYLSLKNAVHAEILFETKAKYSILEDIIALSKWASFTFWMPILGWIPIIFLVYAYFQLKKSKPKLDR